MAQPIAVDNDLICINVQDSQKVLRCFKETELKDQKIMLLEAQITNLKKEKELMEREIDIQKRLTEVAERRAEVEHTAYERQKELTDRALKLAEISKPKSNWELQGLLGIAAFLIGALVAK